MCTEAPVEGAGLVGLHVVYRFSPVVDEIICKVTTTCRVCEVQLDSLKLRTGRKCTGLGTRRVLLSNRNKALQPTNEVMCPYANKKVTMNEDVGVSIRS